MKSVPRYLHVLFLVWVTGTACRDAVSTSPTPDEPPVLAPSGAAAAEPNVSDFEDFACEDLEEVRVRFSDPGYVRANEVAVYAAFLGAPPGDKFLRIFWDYGNERERFQIVDTQEGEVRRDNDQLFDIVELVEHTYEGVTAQMELTVRVELVHEEGNARLCGRNRRITIQPPAASMAPLNRLCGVSNGGTYCGGNCTSNTAEFADAYCRIGGFARAKSFVEHTTGLFTDVQYYQDSTTGLPKSCTDVLFTSTYGAASSCTCLTNLICTN